MLLLLGTDVLPLSQVSTPATPQRHSSINYSGGGQVFKTPPAMAGVCMDRGVLQSQPHHGVDCDFSFEISPVPKEEEEEPSADIVDEDGLATWRTASEKKAWIEAGPSSVRPHGPESPSPGRREADCSMDGHSNRADAAEVGRHVTTLLPLETGEDGGSSIHVRPEVSIVVLEQDREGSRAGEVVHRSPMQTQSQRQGEAGQDSECQKNAHEGAGEVVCDCLDQSASKRCAQSPLFSSDSSGSYSSSRSSSPETAQRVAGADPAVCERVSMGNKSVAAWLNLSLTPLERQRYGLGEAGLVNIDEGELCVADDRLENAAGIHDVECDEALAHVDCDQMLFVAGDILRRCHHDSPSVAKLALRRVPVVVDSPGASKASESGNSTEKESKGSHVRDESPEADPSRGSKIWDEGDLVSAKAIPETATKSRGIFDLISMLSKALSPQVVRPTDPMQRNIVKSPHEEKASTPHVQHSDSSEKSCVASRRQTPDTTVGSSSGGRRKSNSVRVSGDRDELSKKGLLLINGREDCKPIRGQLFLDGEQLLVPDPAIALLRCR